MRRDAGTAGSGREERAEGGPGAEAIFDHVAIAARSFDRILPLLETLTGERATAPVRVESQGVEVSFVGERIELIRPLAPGSGVARFVDARGTGLHHVACQVEDLDGRMAELKTAGYRFTAEEPAIGAKGHRIAFLHPGTAGGVLIELVEGGSRRGSRSSG